MNKYFKPRENFLKIKKVEFPKLTQNSAAVTPKLKFRSKWRCNKDALLSQNSKCLHLVRRDFKLIRSVYNSKM